MEKNKLKKFFLRFLKNTNGYTQFVKHFNCEKGVSERMFWANTTHKGAFNGEINNGFNSYLNNLKRPSDLLQYAFLWEKTEEGYEFWEDLSRKWSSFCTINKI